MAFGEGRREVPDSEDEPMTSSPANISDHVAHKLSVTAPAPPQDAQDAQDALQKAARPHQGTTVNVANLANDRTDGLGAEHGDAPIDIVTASNATTDAELDNATAMQGADATAVSTLPDLTLESIASSSAAETDMTSPTPPTNIADEQIDAMNQLGSTINETKVDQAELQSSSGPVHEAGKSTDSGAELSQPGLQTSTSSKCVSAKDRETESRRQEPCAPNDVSGEIVRSQQDTAPIPERTLRTVDGGWAHSYDRLGNEENHQASTDSSLQGQAEDVGSISDAKLANDNLAPRRDTDAVQPRPKITDQPESCDTPTDVTSDQQISQDTTGTAHLKSKTRERDTAMNIDSSVETDASDPASRIKEEAASSQSLTNDIAQLSTPTSAEDASTQDARETPMDMPGATLTEEQPGRVASSFLTATQPSQDSQSSITSEPLAAENGPMTAKTPQEITLDELRVQKSAMLATLAALPAIRVLMEENASSDTVMSDGDDEPTEADIMAAANKIVKDHIKLLHEYNELKDVGQGLMGLIADQRGVRIVEVQEEFGIDAKD